MDMKQYIHKLTMKTPLVEEEARDLINQLLDNKATPVQLGAFIEATDMQDASPDELYWYVQEIQKRLPLIATTVSPTIDLLGTGADLVSLFAVDTSASFVAAAADCNVIKYSVQPDLTKSGTAQNLNALGANINLEEKHILSVFEKTNLAFHFPLFKQNVFENVQQARNELGYRTLFDLMHVLLSSFQSKFRVIGAFNEHAAEGIAKAIQKQDITKALVVYGTDGLDSFSLLGKTVYYEVTPLEIKKKVMVPEDVGLQQTQIEELQKAHTSEENAKMIASIMNNEKSPKTDVVALNAGALLYCYGKTSSLEDGIRLAQETIASGKALRTLQQYIDETNTFKQD